MNTFPLSSHSALQGLGWTLNLNEECSSAGEISPEEDIAPYYVLARGEKAIAAYQGALEDGEIIDSPVKVMLIGEDRAGKTNVRNALKDEKFDPKESILELTFVGSPPGEYKKVEQWFLDNTYINRNQLTIRGYCSDPEELKMMFYRLGCSPFPYRGLWAGCPRSHFCWGSYSSFWCIWHS